MAPHIPIEGHTRNRRHDLAGERQAQVRVLEVLGCRVQGLLVRQPLDDLVAVWKSELGAGPVRIIRLAWQARGVRQQRLDGDGRSVRVSPLDIEP